MGIDAQMLVKTKAEITKEQVSNLAYRLGSAFWHDKFFIFRSPNRFGWEPRHCLEIVNVYRQDGPDVLPEDGETLIEVHLRGRYYGVDYERGDLSTYIAVASWLECNIPNCEIWYGGDSSGVLAVLFDAKARAELWQYFCEVGHAPYTDYFDGHADDYDRPVCQLCAKSMRRNGWGQNYAAFYCSGCGLRLETTDDGETFHEPSSA